MALKQWYQRRVLLSLSLSLTLYPHPLPLTPIPHPNPKPTKASYGPSEDPSTFDSLRPWGETNMVQWRHVLHYRDLYQQKLAYVREFLSSVDRLEHWASQGLAFLKHTADAEQYYDEGSEGRCSAYDPFNAVDEEGTTQTNAHKYTILPLEFGKCGGCNKKFLTGDPLTVLALPLPLPLPPNLTLTPNLALTLALTLTLTVTLPLPLPLSLSRCSTTWCATRTIGTRSRSTTCRASRGCSPCTIARSRCRSATRRCATSPSRRSSCSSSSR